MVFSPQGHILAISNEEATHLFDLKKGKLIQSFPNILPTYASLIFSPDGNFFAVSSSHSEKYYKSTIYLYDLTAKKVIHELSFDGICMYRFFPDIPKLLFWDYKIIEFEYAPYASGAVLRSMKRFQTFDMLTKETDIVLKSEREIGPAVLSADGKALIWEGYTDEFFQTIDLFFFDLKSKSNTKKLPQEHRVTGISQSADGQYIAFDNFILEGSFLKIFDTTTQQVVYTAKSNEYNRYSEFSADGRFLLTPSFTTNKIRLLEFNKAPK
ncbi:MAG: WD40 repeat domain-containing protein [Desulfovibrio sp.]